MSTELLSFLKEKAALLTDEERRELQAHLNADSQGETSPAHIRFRRMEWLKAHRMEYAGFYVAFDGEHPVGKGSTIREAREQALERGVSNPFLLRVPHEVETLY